MAKRTILLAAFLLAGCGDETDEAVAGSKADVLEFHAEVGGGTLAGYWPFDGSGQDASGAGNHLSLNGGVGFVAGKFGQGINFLDSENLFAVRSGDDAEFDFGTGSFTIQLWVNFYSVQGGQTLIEKYDDYNLQGWRFSVFGSSTIQFSAQPAFSLSQGSLSIATRVWHQIVIRRNGNLIVMFFDGVESETISNFTPIPNTTLPLLVGKRNEIGGPGLSPAWAVLDEVAIWNTALTTDEIQFLYNGGAGRPVTTDYTPPPPPTPEPEPPPPPLPLKAADTTSAPKPDTTLPCAAGASASHGLAILAGLIAVAWGLAMLRN